MQLVLQPRLEKKYLVPLRLIQSFSVTCDCVNLDVSKQLQQELHRRLQHATSHGQAIPSLPSVTKDRLPGGGYSQSWFEKYLHLKCFLSIIITIIIIAIIIVVVIFIVVIIIVIIFIVIIIVVIIITITSKGKSECLSGWVGISPDHSSNLCDTCLREEPCLGATEGRASFQIQGPKAKPIIRRRIANRIPLQFKYYFSTCLTCAQTPCSSKAAPCMIPLTQIAYTELRTILFSALGAP